MGRAPRAANSAFSETCKFVGLYLGTLVAGALLTTYYLLLTTYHLLLTTYYLLLTTTYYSPSSVGDALPITLRRRPDTRSEVDMCISASRAAGDGGGMFG